MPVDSDTEGDPRDDGGGDDNFNLSIRSHDDVEGSHAAAAYYYYPESEFVEGPGENISRNGSKSYIPQGDFDVDEFDIPFTEDVQSNEMIMPAFTASGTVTDTVAVTPPPPSRSRQRTQAPIRTPPVSCTARKRANVARKHLSHRIDWLDAHLDMTQEQEPSIVYIMAKKLIKREYVYVGCTRRSFNCRLSEHNNKRPNGAGWKKALVVSGFDCFIAASRFESLVKRKGKKRGVQSKIDAATKEAEHVARETNGNVRLILT